MTWDYHPMVAWEESDDDGYFVTNATRGGIVSLSDNAAAMWELLPGRTTAELTDAVAELYTVEASEIADDVAAFLSDLARQGLAVDA